MGIAFLGRWLGRPAKSGVTNGEPACAATAENPEAQFVLGQRCAAEEDHEPDFARAAEYYQKAAAQGHSAAQFNLGLMYRQGHGVVRNETTALRWLLQAATQGHAGAQYYSGVRLHCASKDGQQSTASERRVEALKWLKLAVIQGYPGAGPAEDFVALEMTRAEVDESGRRARAFAASRPNGSGVLPQPAVPDRSGTKPGTATPRGLSVAPNPIST